MLKITITNVNNITSYAIDKYSGKFEQSKEIFENDIEELLDVLLLLPHNQLLDIKNKLSNNNEILINDKAYKNDYILSCISDIL